MRRMLFCFVVIVPGCTDPDGTIEHSSSPAGPAFVVDRNEINLGPLRVNSSSHIATFELSNRGKEPLEIQQIEVSCGCLNASPPKGVVRPGDSMALRVSVSVDAAGDKTTQVVVHTNDPSHRMAMLLVSWTGVAAAEAIPSRIDFGGIRPGEAATLQVDVRLHDSSLDWSDHRIECSESLQVVEVAPSDDMVATYEVSVVGEENEGPRNGYVRFSSESADRPMLDVVVTWEIVDVVTVMPVRLLLGPGGRGASFHRQIVIRSNVDSPVEIAEVDVSDGLTGVEVHFPDSPSQVIVLDVSCVLPRTTE